MSVFTDEVKKAEAEGIKFVYKSDSVLMQVLDKVLFFNPNFSKMTTTLWDTIYFPSGEYLETRSVRRNLTTLFHEKEHVRQFRKHPVLMPILYLFPQCLAVFSILSIFAVANLHFLWCLLFLLFLLPLPAHFRAYYEAKAYSFHIEEVRQRYGMTRFPRDNKIFRKYLWFYYKNGVSPFTSFKYYRMLIFKPVLTLYLRYCIATTNVSELTAALDKDDQELNP